MRELLKRLARMVIGYGAVQWAGPFLSLIFTPIITRILTPADYGVADYLLTIVSALSTMALIALPQALITHFNDAPEDLEWQRTVTGSALTIAVFSGLLFGTLIFLSAPILTTYVPILEPYTSLLRLIGATFVFGLMASVLTMAAQAALRVRWGMIFSLISIIGTVLGNVLFIVLLRLGVVGMILTPMVTGLSVWLAAIIMMRGMIGRPAPTTTRLLLLSGLVLLPTLLSSWILQVSDRLFLAQYVTETELGYYAIANKMASLVSVAMTPIYAAWTPLALAVQYQEHARERYVSMSRYLIGAALIVGLGIGLFAPEILLMLTRPAYLPAAPYVGFLTLMYVFSGFGAVLTTGALMGKQLSSVTGSVVAGAAINVLLNILLIPRYGVWGAVVATIIGYGVPQIILYLVLQKRYPIPYPMGRLLAALGIQIGLTLVGVLFIPTEHVLARTMIKTALFAMLPISYYGLGLVTSYEVKQMRLFIQNRLRLASGTGMISL